MVTSNYRDSRGKFKKGNPGGTANRLGAAAQQLRAALLKSVTVEDIRRLGQSLLAKAIAGDIESAKLLLKYLIGEPAKAEPLEAVEENALERESRLRRLRLDDEAEARREEDRAAFARQLAESVRKHAESQPEDNYDWSQHDDESEDDEDDDER